MTFAVPTFNLRCNIWRNGNAPPAVADLNEECNLAFGRRTASYQGLYSSNNEPIMSLLLPPGADIRGPQTGLPDAFVEVPAGSGRYYVIIGVDDSGKGFPNEHRIALLTWTTDAGDWPVPMP